MSEVSDSAIVRLIIADYVSIVDGGKVTVVGGGLTAVNVNPQVGFTAPFGVYVSVTVPPELAGEETALELVLEDVNGEPVGIQGPTGEAQAIRIGQNITFEEQRYAPFAVPPRLMRPRHQMALNIAQGMPLLIDRLYVWRVKLDHDSRNDWTEQMYVLGAVQSPPVIG